jgi:hypothetical protein
MARQSPAAQAWRCDPRERKGWPVRREGRAGPGSRPSTEMAIFDLVQVGWREAAAPSRVFNRRNFLQARRQLSSFDESSTPAPRTVAGKLCSGSLADEAFRSSDAYRGSNADSRVDRRLGLHRGLAGRLVGGVNRPPTHHCPFAARHVPSAFVELTRRPKERTELATGCNGQTIRLTHRRGTSTRLIVFAPACLGTASEPRSSLRHVPAHTCRGCMNGFPRAVLATPLTRSNDETHACALDPQLLH